MRSTRLLAVALLLGLAAAQEAPPNGPRRVDPMWHALVGATVHVAPGRTLEDATVVLKGERIDAVGTAAPEGARVWDCKGLHVYAGLIDAYVPVDVPPGEPRHWNPRITPWRLAREVDDATAAELRALGFAAAAIAPRSGILRGRASLVSLAPRDPDLSVPRPAVYAESLWQSAGFDTVEEPDAEQGRRREGYPTSQMGAIALLRQSLLDGLAPEGALLLDTEDEMEALRAAKIAAEFGRTALVVGCGTEFRRIDAIAATGLPVIVPLRFPEPPDVSSVGAADAADLRDLMTWEQAPTNPRRLDAAGATVALTTAKLLKREVFYRRLAEAMRHGLGEERALAMLTTTPSKLLGADDRMGTIEAGKLGNLVVTEGPLFVREPVVRDVWIDGRRHEVTAAPAPSAGDWRMEGPPLPAPLTLSVTRKPRGGYEAKLATGDRKAEAQRLSIIGERIGFSFDGEPLGTAGRFTLSAVASADALDGQGMGPAGERFRWRAARAEAPPPPPPPPPEPADAPETYGTPFGPYALDQLPAQPDRLIVKGATLWTCGQKGVIENGELEVRAGRIVYAGPARGAAEEGATVIDASGRHVTPGIVDCHSHTGISKGVNEAGQAVTAEVRIGDVTDPDSISWYRELAGGVTTVNSLHGSANPIGGQNQVNKARWGVRHPDEMHFEGAPPGIKFALGENVKQSNWGDDFTTRYPQTRMGVETLMRDRFLAAREYAAHHDRRDLELEALAEVLAGTRLVHCHSYRQDEILMLCRLAEEFGFTIGTFQHVLEGYKVADAIRDRSGGGSSFSDWWAYKVEVQDAIPWNGALMREVGVCVSFNSDSDEMARRLNLEAAKAVKYGNVPPAEALKFVTLNPAKQLKIDGHVGSLEEGKDADFAIWSGPPLSVYTRCVATWIDGREYFSLEQDRKHRERIAAERQRITQKILGRKKEKEEEEGHGEEKPPARSKTWQCGECGCREDR